MPNFIHAFTRNHFELFEFSNKSTIKYIDNIQFEATLVKYQNVILKIDLNNICLKNENVYEAIVDWYHLKVEIFKNKEDRLNKLSIYDGNFTLPSSFQINEHFENILYEAFLYVKRGHSIHSRSCQCKDISTIQKLYETKKVDRLEVLGLHNLKRLINKECMVVSNHQMVSIKSLLLELGIYVSNKGSELLETFIKRLLHYGKFSLIIKDQDTFLENIDWTANSVSSILDLYINSPLCCMPIHIQKVEDLKRSIELMHPKPFVWSISLVSNLKEKSTLTLQELKQISIIQQAEIIFGKNNFCRIIEFEQTKGHVKNKTYVFYKNDTELEAKFSNIKCDGDIKKIWHNCKLHVNQSFYDLFNTPKFIDAAKFQPVATINENKKKRKYQFYDIFS